MAAGVGVRDQGRVRGTPCYLLLSTDYLLLVTSSDRWKRRPGLSSAVSHNLAVNVGCVLVSGGGTMVRSEICTPSPSLGVGLGLRVGVRA